MVYTFCAVYCEPPKNRSPDKNSPRSQSKCFQYVCTATYPPVYIDLTMSIDNFDGLRQCFNTGWNPIKLATAMIGDNNAIYTMLNSQRCILSRENTFKHDG